MNAPTPSTNTRLARKTAEFETLVEGLEYAARGETGINFYSGKGELVERLAYARLRDEAVSLAGRLLAAGLQPGDRVALLAETDGDFVRAFFACQYAGLLPAPLPLPAGFGGREAYVDLLRRLIVACDANAALGPVDLVAFLQDATAELPLRLVGSIADLASRPATDLALPAANAGNLSYLQFSSGSTRTPKGVSVTHQAVLSNAGAIARDGLQIVEGDRCCSWLPLYHDMGLVGFLLTPLLCQLSIDLMATRDFARRPLLWPTLITRHGGTLSYSPSFGYELSARRAETASTDGLDLRHWRVAGIGGDMIRPNVLSRFAATFQGSGFSASAFVPSYGMAEVTLAISFAPLGQGVEADRVDLDRLAEGRAEPTSDAARSREFVLCGTPLAGHEAEIRDEAGRPLGEREVGRIFLRGPSVMSGYFREPEETARAMSGGWLDTGDLGYWLRGQLVITGRAKDLIIINGRNIYPQDLEWEVERLPGVRSGDVAVFSVDDGAAERIVVLVQCRPTEAGARSTLAAAVSAAVKQAASLDCEVVLVPPHGLPQTSSGKLSRSRARQRYASGEYGADPRLGPALASAG